jgi:BirA family transcriptional regulator, biotin operon repressor / biotin---[acetyl-CoA-carboxylase] ligase
MQSDRLNLLLDALRERMGEWVSPALLMQNLSLSEVELGEGLDSLVGEGYAIQQSTKDGICLSSPEGRLIAREIRRGFESATIGQIITCLEHTESTNDDAWRAALAGAEDGSVIFAEEQSSGRGRMGRSWQSPKGSGILMTVVLRPGLDARESHVLTAMASVAVAQALRDSFKVRARIRWPNDIFVGDRKIAGILVEGRSLATATAFVVGIGLNVNLMPDDFPIDIRGLATSLAIESGCSVSRTEVASQLLLSLDRWYRDLRSGDVGRIANVWRRLSSTLGQRVLLIENGVESRGTVLDLSMSDGLIVRLDKGLTRIFHPSTVTLRHLPENP